MFTLPEINEFKDNWNVTYKAKFVSAKGNEEATMKVTNEFAKFVALNENFIDGAILILFLQKLYKEFGIDEMLLHKTIQVEKDLLKPKEETKSVNIKESKFTKAIRFIHEHYPGIYINSLTSDIMRIENKNSIKLDIESMFTDFAFEDITVSQKRLFNYFYARKYVRQENPILNILNDTDYKQGIDPDYIKEVLNYLKFPFIDKMPFDLHLFYRKMFEKFLVRSIDNAVNDESLPNKQTLILKGTSNSRKTSFLRWLYRPFEQYSTENVILNGKEIRTKKAMCQNIFILNDEFDKFSDKELREYKILSTEKEFKFKAYQGYLEKSHKRRANLLSATEKDKFLTDKGGSIRFFIIEITNTITDPISADLLDNTDLSLAMWSQAFALWKDQQNGFYDSQPTTEEILQLETLNKRYYTYKNLEDAILHLYPRANNNENENTIELNASELLEHIKRNPNFPKDLISGKKKESIGKFLSKNNYIKIHTNRKGESQKYRYKIRISK